MAWGEGGKAKRYDNEMRKAALAALARRANLPYPALLALAGAALALIPGTPSVSLDPELALALFVAPVLLDAAFDASPRDLKENWRPVAGLALLAVGLTVAAVAVVARWFSPELPWAVAIALGAIVAPPDAAAATAVLRQLKPPHRLLVILEGESLFNDATALLIYRLAVAAAVGGMVIGWNVLPVLFLVTVGSLVLGLVLSRVMLFLTGRVTDIATAVVVQFIGTFAVWIIAEKLHLSGILTMVVFAMTVARTAPDRIPARLLALYAEEPYTSKGGSRPFEPMPASPRDRLAKWRALRRYRSQLPLLGMPGRLDRRLLRLVLEPERVAWPAV